MIRTIAKTVAPKWLISEYNKIKSLERYPSSNMDTVSDLFPFKVTAEWNTYFELLNIPAMIDPFKAHGDYNVDIVLFNENGKIIKNESIRVKSIGRTTINIGELIKEENVNSGTFASFHKCSQLDIVGGGYLVDRGYVGYENRSLSQVRGYVHGNFNAISLNNRSGYRLLGKSFKDKKTYFLQHELTGEAQYELVFVNSDKRDHQLEIKVSSLIDGSTEHTFSIPSGGIRSLSLEVQSDDRKMVEISSKLKLPRPVVFRTNASSIDVFHG